MSGSPQQGLAPTDREMRNFMRLTEKQFGGWSLFAGAAAITVGYVFSPGRGAVDTVPSTNLTDLTLAMARLEVALAPVFAAMSIAGLIYMGLLGWGLVSSKDSQTP